MNKLLPAFSCLALGLVMCQPSSGTENPTSSTTGGTGGTGTACSTTADCTAALDAGNCFFDAGVDAGSGFCALCATNTDCAPLGTNFVCTAETCVPGADAGPGAGKCNVSCECASGKACDSATNLCEAPPSMCEADTDCPCNAVCESHNCLLTCDFADAGNSGCTNPTPKCYSSFGRCGFCTAATDCPTGQTCLASGSCGVAQASTTSGTGTSAATTTGTHTTSAATTSSGSSSSPIGGLIGGSGGSLGGLGGTSTPIGGILGGSAIGGGTSPIGGILGGSSTPIGGLLGGSSGGSSSSGGISTCDTTSCGGCSTSDVCYCPTLTIPPVACVATAGCGGSGGLPGICGPSIGL